MTGLLEYKNLLGGSIKDVDTKNSVVTGYLSKFGNEDYDKDIILEGAFKRSLQQRRDKIMFLNQHDWKQPHGFFDILQEDKNGLYFESRPLIDTTYSQDAIKLYAAGIIKEHSIGYQTVQSEYDSKTEIRSISEVKLYEGSNVTMGANPETPFTGFKSLTIKDINEDIKKITSVLKTGTVSDECFIQLEIALKQLVKAGYELGTQKALNIEEPPQSTLEVDSLIAIFKKHI